MLHEHRRIYHHVITSIIMSSVRIKSRLFGRPRGAPFSVDSRAPGACALAYLRS